VPVIHYCYSRKYVRESGEGIRYTAATAALTAMADHARTANTANTAHAHTCLTAATAYQLLAQEDVRRLAEDDHDRVCEGARSDVANALGTSGGVAQEMIDAGRQLDDLLHHTKNWFVPGLLSYDKVKILARTLGDVNPKLVPRIEEEAVQAAPFKGPRALRRAIEKLICNASPEEATRLRKEAGHHRTAVITL
jgi:Domain of unknown function (DUF222)